MMDSPSPAPLTPLGARTPLAHPALYGIIGVLSLVIVAGAAWAFWPQGTETPGPSPSAAPSATATNKAPVVPESWERFDSTLVNLSFSHPPGFAFEEHDLLREYNDTGRGPIAFGGTYANFSHFNGEPGSFDAVSSDFWAQDSVFHIIEGTLDSRDSFRVTVFDEKFTVIEELGGGMYQVTGYGNIECSPFVSSILLVRPPTGSHLQYIQFYLGVPDGFTVTDMLPTDQCTPTDEKIRGRIASVVDGKVVTVNRNLETAMGIARTFDTTPNGPYALKCSSAGSPVDVWGGTYDWYGGFKSQIISGWTVEQICYNALTNDAAYLKSKGNAEPDNQLGVYHGTLDYFSKAPMHKAPLYGSCRIDRWMPATVTYTCRGGDAGLVVEETYRYTLATGLLERTRRCGGSDMNYSCEASVQRIAEVAPWCSSSAIPSDMGGSYYESDPKFQHMGSYLASVLTAYECGDERLKEVWGGPSGMYGLGISLRLTAPPPTELRSALKLGRFKPVDCDTGPMGTETSQCLQWQLTEEVQVRDILFLRHWYDAVEFADCIHCG